MIESNFNFLIKLHSEIEDLKLVAIWHQANSRVLHKAFLQFFEHNESSEDDLKLLQKEIELSYLKAREAMDEVLKRELVFRRAVRMTVKLRNNSF